MCVECLIGKQKKPILFKSWRWGEKLKPPVLSLGEKLPPCRGSRLWGKNNPLLAVGEKTNPCLCWSLLVHNFLSHKVTKSQSHKVSADSLLVSADSLLHAAGLCWPFRRRGGYAVFPGRGWCCLSWTGDLLPCLSVRRSLVAGRHCRRVDREVDVLAEYQAAIEDPLFAY